MIYLLYGQPGSGKTSLGKLLASHLDTPFIIDGDEFREMFTNKNYGREGREENIRNANAVATYLDKRGKDGNWKETKADISKIKRELKWKPKISFEDLVTDMVESDIRLVEKEI